MRIVLTGGPGAGKSTAVRRLVEDDAFANWRRDLGGVAAVTESATEVYGRRGLRWDRIDEETRRDVQREIYRRQLQAEAEAPTDVGVVLLDRGTIDGSAYWPDGPEAYWRDVGSAPEVEAKRYDAVLLLQSSAAVGAYDGESTNAVRFESAAGALESDQTLHRLWSVHPRLIPVAATLDFESKLGAIATTIRELIGA
ncbi:MAG: AAA family ATPase [Planctomycetota bacterium]